MENQFKPLVTVIIPMYNAEKYIAQCLESLVKQTFKNFEVIVVNDCSTDNSVAEVKKFEPQFQGRLILKSMKKNSGTPGLPRNTAIPLARGKYITFLDSDDLLTDTALAEIVPVAEETNADVIHASHFFNLQDGTANAVVSTFQRRDFVNAPTREPFDIVARVVKFINYGFVWWGCNKLFRKDFLIENNIKFPPIKAWEDLIFAFQCVVCAKNYVRVPNIFYIYRRRSDSLSQIPKNPFDMIETTMKVVAALDNFMSRVEFFKQNPIYRYSLLDWHLQERLNVYCKAFYERDNLQPFLCDLLFRKKFSSTNFKEYLGFVSYVFTTATNQRFLLYKMTEEKNQLQQKISELEGELARQKINSFDK